MSKPRYRLRNDGRVSIVDSWLGKECGLRLREERERASLSQADMAVLVGVTTAMVGRYERGESEPGSTVLLRLMVAKLDVSYILGGSTQSPLPRRRGSRDSRAEREYVRHFC